MSFIAGAVFFAGYSALWWGWLAATDHVNPGPTDTFWWPSIRDLMAPGRMAQAVPPRVTRAAGKSQLDKQNAQDVATWEKENAAAVAAGKPPPNIIVKATNQK